MMDFKEFVNQMEQDIKKEFAAKETGIDIRQNVIEKLQQEPYTALSVTPEGQNVGMNLNMDQLYDQVQRGRPYENVRDAAVQLIEQQVKQMPQFDLKDFMDYRVFEIGDKYEARRDAKDKAKEDPDLRKSVLKDLQDKKQDIDLKPKTNTHHKSVSDPVM